MFKSLAAVGAAIALVGVSVPATASCWSPEETSAATIRDLQSLLMVATLRCRAAGMDITADYNGFVQANRAAIQKENERIKAHFIRAAGPVAGQKAYDSFATHLANGYGGDASSPAACENFAALAHEGTLMAGSEEGLLLLASRQGVVTDVPGGMCQQVSRSSIAMATPQPQPMQRADAPQAYPQAYPPAYGYQGYEPRR